MTFQSRFTIRRSRVKYACFFFSNAPARLLNGAPRKRLALWERLSKGNNRPESSTRRRPSRTDAALGGPRDVNRLHDGALICEGFPTWTRRCHEAQSNVPYLRSHRSVSTFSFIFGCKKGERGLGEGGKGNDELCLCGVDGSTYNTLIRRLVQQTRTWK